MSISKISSLLQRSTLPPSDLPTLSTSQSKPTMTTAAIVPTVILGNPTLFLSKYSIGSRKNTNSCPGSMDLAWLLSMLSGLIALQTH